MRDEELMISHEGNSYHLGRKTQGSAELALMNSECISGWWPSEILLEDVVSHRALYHRPLSHSGSWAMQSVPSQGRGAVADKGFLRTSLITLEKYRVAWSCY